MRFKKLTNVSFLQHYFFRKEIVFPSNKKLSSWKNSISIEIPIDMNTKICNIHAFFKLDVYFAYYI